MSKQILFVLIIGILSGYVFLDALHLELLSQLTEGALAILLFGVGIELGKTSELRSKLRNFSPLVLLTPLVIALGSILGSMLVGLGLNLPIMEAAAVGSGFGWYSLSAVIIAQTYDVSVGALAFLSNVFREVLAVILIPIVAVKLGFLPAIAPGGATAMDVTLPIISKATDEQTTILAFYCGLILSLMVPIIVPLFLRFAA